MSVIRLNNNPCLLFHFPSGPKTSTAISMIFRVLVLSFLLVACSGPISLSGAYPEKPIKVIVPTNAGGETDGLARLIQRSIAEKKLLSQKMVIVNLPGAGGTMGTRRIKQSKPDGYTLGLWHSGFVTSKAMGIVDYDHTDFELICMSGYTELGLGVHRDSQFKTIEDLLDYARKNPRSVKFSTNVGLPVHLIPLLFAEETGIEFRFIQTGGGSQRLASILGRHTDITMFSTTAFLNFEEVGLKPILSFSAERDPLMPDIPTAKEVGADFGLVEIRVWVAPKGTPEPILEVLRHAIRSVMEDPEISEEIRAFGVVPKYGTSEDVQPMLDELLEKVAPLVSKARNPGR
ncbi:MAG: tripartite tricarboxylate transporter substrate binding protein [Verrucomicrobia bacterium]|nr:tripartite tricarboxylate transporter substrate binding protein [Verrucomicrobiota bacterium]